MNSERRSPLELVEIGPGCFYLRVPELDLRLLCGCPPDAIKLLGKKGYVTGQDKGGFYTETGPNGILLSDQRVQGYEIANLTEFPVLHMLYKQGAAIPGHPNFGMKPMLIGRAVLLKGQAEYLKRGNYGLYHLSEYQHLGLAPSVAEMHLDLKQQFAYGQFLETNELMDLVPFDEEQVSVGALSLSRLGPNHFQVQYKGHQVQFDLGLKKGQQYITSYQMPAVKPKMGQFSLVHIGDGDGWDIERPCLNTVLVANQQKYLIDAGPFVNRNLKLVGIGTKEIAGLFVTHVHDDHLGGLYGLLRRRPTLRIFATPRIYASLIKKHAALTGKSEAYLTKKLNFVPLSPNQWNQLGDFEVKPVPSAHPIDTTLFLFQMKGPSGYVRYGHLTDIVSLKALQTYVENCKFQEPAQLLWKRLVEVYQMPLDVKKVDVGGGPVHGNITDFIDDPSRELLFSHTSSVLSSTQQKGGTQPKFGGVHILIP